MAFKLLFILAIYFLFTCAFCNAQNPIITIPGYNVQDITKVSELNPSGKSDQTYQPVAISPDGKLVVSIYDVPGGMGPKIQLRLINVDTGEIINPSLAPNFLTPSDPSFDPTGKFITFLGIAENDKNGNAHGLWITDIHGANPIRITPPGYDISFSAWSPDGKTIAIVRKLLHANNDKNDYGSILIMQATEPYTVLQEIRLTWQEAGLGQFSPDGTWLTCILPLSSDLGLFDIRHKKIYTIFSPRTLTLSISPYADPPSLKSIGWLPGSKQLLVSISGSITKIEDQTPEGIPRSTVYHQIILLDINGYTKFIQEGDILCSSSHGDIWILRIGERNYRIRLSQ